MKKCKLFIILFIIFSTTKVQAICDSNLNISLANNISYTYKFNGTSFDLTFTNLHNMFYIVDQDNNYYGGFNELTVYGLLPNNVYTYKIYSSIFDCKIDAVRTINVQTPAYNYYYNTNICDGAEDFKYCKRWYNNNLDLYEMNYQVLEYKNSQTEKTINEAVYKKTIFDKLMNIYAKYYYIILPMLILVSIYAIYRLDKKDSLF